MATKTPSITASAWNAALAEYRELEARIVTHTSNDPGLRRIEDYTAMEAAEHALLVLDAPDITAVCDKLNIIFQDELQLAELPMASMKRRVIGDLRRIEFAYAE
jgi:hypothetical protein